jgi:hypothetical protein
MIKVCNNFSGVRANQRVDWPNAKKDPAFLGWVSTGIPGLETHPPIQSLPLYKLFLYIPYSLPDHQTGKA